MQSDFNSSKYMASRSIEHSTSSTEEMGEYHYTIPARWYSD